MCNTTANLLISIIKTPNDTQSRGLKSRGKLVDESSRRGFKNIERRLPLAWNSSGKQEQ